MPFFRRNNNGPSKAELKAKLEAKLLNAKQNPEPIYDLSDCGLKEVPSGVFSWCKVCLKEVLDLHNNALVELPSNIGKLATLQVLYLNSNKLKTLPSELSELKKLQTLHLSGNMLKCFPECICNLQSLRTLDISNNKITMLPKSLSLVRTLDTLILDADQMQYPPADICVQGTEAIMKFLCEETGREYIPPSKVVSNVLEVDSGENSVNKAEEYEKYLNDQWKQLEMQKDQKRKERIEVERLIQEHNENQAKVVTELQKKRLELLDDLAESHNKLQEELLEAQQKKDGERHKLLSHLVIVEESSNKVIKELLATAEKSRNNENLIEAQRKEREEFEELFLRKQQESEDLRRKDVLESLNVMIQEENQIKMYDLLKQEMAKRIHRESEESVTDLEGIMAKKSEDQQKILAQLLEEEEFQKEVFAVFLQNKDEQSAFINDQIQLIQEELSSLTMLEMKQRDLKIAFEVDVLEQKREILTKLLMQLFEQQKLRQEELKQRLQEMEAQRLEEQQDYWLLQYQRLMDYKPDTLQELEENMDPVMKDILIKAGAQEYVSVLARKEITLPQFLTMTDDDLRQNGIHRMSSRFAILAELDVLRGEQQRAEEKLTEVESEMEEPTAPSKAATTEVTAHLEAECVICLDKQCAMLFLNCGHVCCCAECGKDLSSCPLCRGDIAHKIVLRFAN